MTGRHRALCRKCNDLVAEKLALRDADGFADRHPVLARNEMQQITATAALVIVPFAAPRAVKPQCKRSATTKAQLAFARARWLPEQASRNGFGTVRKRPRNHTCGRHSAA